ncbi:MAG TPA: hypothetical protein VK808_10985 [Bacteroidia bacterium]|jgi:hypothetical protein|nr:hypothetical protein [Bacteroidia bacterium]
MQHIAEHAFLKGAFWQNKIIAIQPGESRPLSMQNGLQHEIKKIDVINGDVPIK